jgi:hypothetical protein
MKSKKVISVLIFLYCLGANSAFSQIKTDSLYHHKQCYHAAYDKILGMLEGKIPMSFKQAVFLMENAYLDGSLSYEQYNSQITNIAGRLRELIKERHLQQFKTAGNWATFTYMTDSIPANNFKPFVYDFDNFLPEKDPTVSFVTKVLRTGKGNCNSLPELYKILAEEIGATAYLALAPLHCYIKHQDENGKWVNLEMTSGSFARDEWIMQESGVTVEQVKSGIYMNPLSEKESLALVLKDLAANYQFQFGADDFDLIVSNNALKYYPTGANLYIVKYEHFRLTLLRARSENNQMLVDKCNRMLFGIDQKLIELAYKAPSKKDYQEWVKENEQHRLLQESKEHAYSNNK